MEQKPVEINAVIDSAKFIGLPLFITVLMIFMMLVDGFDLQTMPFVAPVLVTAWGVSKSMLTPAITASMVGMAVGSVALGWLGDRIGRRYSYIVCLAFLFAGSLLCAYATSLWHLVAWRFVTGIGLGGVTPLAATLISEWTPKKSRSVAVACAVVAVPLGGMIGAGVAQWIIPVYGWRMIFFIGACLPLLFFVVAWFLLPESPKFLAQRRERHPQLANCLNRLLGEKRFNGSETFTVDEPPAPPGNAFALLLKPAYLSTTLLLWAAFAFNTLGLYAMINWLPTVMKDTGFALNASLQGSKLFNLGGFFGAVGGALLIGIYGSRIVGSTLAIIGAIATLLVGMTIAAAVGGPETQLLVLICISGMGFNGMQVFNYTVGAHSYPTYIRASGVGCAQTVSRLGGVLGSTMGGVYFAITPQLPASYFFYAVAGVMVIVAISFYSLRTHIQGKPRGPAKAAAAATA